MYTTIDLNNGDGLCPFTFECVYTIEWFSVGGIFLRLKCAAQYFIMCVFEKKRQNSFPQGNFLQWTFLKYTVVSYI